MGKKRLLREIYEELTAVKEELHSIRRAMESKTDVDTMAHDIADGLQKIFSAMSL